MNTVVVVPTFNERENIGSLLESLLGLRGVHVVVVDDRSPDGTSDVVRAFMKKSSRVHLLEGDKDGLGAAYARGFRFVLRELRPRFVVQMDADGSHDPHDIPRLLGGLSDADLVVGSRYVRGGSTPDWPAYRRFLSWGANVLARVVADVRVRDATAGFRAWRASFLRSLDVGGLGVQGYSFQVATLAATFRLGGRVVELPVVFRDRSHGRSKMSRMDVLEGLFVVFRLGFRAHRVLLPFLVVGASGVLVNLAVFSGLFRLASMHIWLAWLIALETSVLWNFFWHERWTFRDRRQRTSFDRALRYHLASLGGVGVNAVVFFLLLSAGLFVELANFLAIGVATAWNYLLSALWAWRKD